MKSKVFKGQEQTKKKERKKCTCSGNKVHFLVKRKWGKNMIPGILSNLAHDWDRVKRNNESEEGMCFTSIRQPCLDVLFAENKNRATETR